jgi:excisionase family DNA binding protein
LERVYTTEEVAEALRVSVFTVRRLLNSGRLQGFKVGKDWRITEGDLEAFIEASRSKEVRQEGVLDE